jgi:hypothetical protein
MRTDFGAALDAVRKRLGAVLSGPGHRRRLADIDTRIVVSGTRGKSTTTRWLHDAFYRRGYDTFAKITGDEPKVLYNGFVHDINRDATVRLYENERELSRFEDVDVAIVENHGIRQYTTRLVNAQFVDPHLVFLTNVREDHLDSLGSDRRQIARALARAVPDGTPVLCGEQNETLRTYLKAELDRRAAPVEFVTPPPTARSVPGSECVYGLNRVLDWFDEPLIPTETLHGYLDAFRPSWRHLDRGRVYNAASANDVQSTEHIRQSLVGSWGPTIEPLLCLRADRRGRTASFVRYLTSLYERDAINQAHVLGDNQRLFASNVPFPVRRLGPDDSPETHLTSALSTGRPVILMGNAVTDEMQAVRSAIEERAIEGTASATAPLVEDSAPDERRDLGHEQD